jgi:hypothetical protein
MIRTTSIVVIVALLLSPGAAVAQQPVSTDAEISAYRQLAADIPLGSRVKVHIKNGRRMTATLMAVDGGGIVVQRESRLPEPAVRIAFADLARLQRDQKSGFTVGKAIGIGLAAGVGAIITLFAIAVSVSD